MKVCVDPGATTLQGREEEASVPRSGHESAGPAHPAHDPEGPWHPERDGPGAPRTVDRLAAFARRSAACFLLAVAATAEQPDRVALRLVDEASATVHLVVDDDLDLGVRTARAGTVPRVPLAPGFVVGQGEDWTNLTVVRVLNRHQVVEAQFLAFDDNVRGGVRVAAGSDAAGATRIVATPASPQHRPVLRIFNAAGGLQREIEPRGLGAGLSTFASATSSPTDPATSSPPSRSTSDRSQSVGSASTASNSGRRRSTCRPARSCR